jgi:MFS transporter, AAHS family, 4-hydroxybenzoate transporter
MCLNFSASWYHRAQSSRGHTNPGDTMNKSGIQSSESDSKTSAIDVGKIIDDSRLNPVSISVIFLCGLIMMMDGYDYQIISVAASKIMEEWQMKGLTVSKTDFSLVFSAAFLGYFFGAIFCGTLSDRIGRKKALLLGSCIFSVGTLLVYFSNSLQSLIPLRILTGFGIGGAVPCAITLTSEYSPSRGRGKYVSIMYSGFLAGIVLGGFVAGYMLKSIGWRPLFLVGFFAPITVIALLWFKLPESARWLSGRYKNAKQKDALVKLVRSIRPDIRIDAETQFVSPPFTNAGSFTKRLFSGPLAWIIPGVLSFWLSRVSSGKQFFSGTLGWIILIILACYVYTAASKGLFSGKLAWVTPIVWAYYLISSIAVFFIGSWGPILLKLKGFTEPQAATISGWGGIIIAIGCLSSGIFFDKVGFRWGSILYAIAVVSILFTGGREQYYFVVMLWTSGFFINSGHMDVTILAPIVYPPTYRNQGAGAAIAVARIGAMAGPLIGGVLLDDTKLPMSSLLAFVSIPLILAAILCYIAGRQYDFHFGPLYAGKLPEKN